MKVLKFAIAAIMIRIIQITAIRSQEVLNLFRMKIFVPMMDVDIP